MSIKRLNDEERAAYLIGYAVMRQFEEAPPDPDTISEINAVLRWLEHWLTHEELDHVSLMTGFVFDEDLIDLLGACRTGLYKNSNSLILLDLFTGGKIRNFKEINGLSLKSDRLLENDEALEGRLDSEEPGPDDDVPF